ncbi:MAG: flagellar hook-associated protein FlgL [Desulfohalobiaceae bacterium]|nr:flagellar hook-associated protein FlgL [Desulfohalobiaceae bacterium]
MKATLGMNYRMLSAELESISSKMYDLRQQSASGKKLNKPSDDPGAMRPVLNFKAKSEATQRYLNHVKTAGGEMELLDSDLAYAENILDRAREVGIAALNATANEADNNTYADQIGQLYDEMLQLANRQTNGRYVFAGYQEETIPFVDNENYSPDDYDPTDASTWPVTYQGDAQVKTVEIAPGKSIQIGMTGNQLFLGDADNNQELDSEGKNVFAVLKDLENAIRINDQEAMGDGLEGLKEGMDQVIRLRGQMGNNAWRIDRAAERLEEESIEFQEIISGYEDADILEVFSQLVQQETAYEAALNVTTRISKLSILDFM